MTQPPSPEDVLKQFASVDAPDKAEDDLLPAITRLEIDVTGIRGQRYQGDFIYKVPTLADQISIGRLKNTYLPQGGAADANASILVEQISYLAVTIQDPKPDWWEPFGSYDATPLSALYKEALSYEQRFHGELANRGTTQNRAAGAGHDDAPRDDADGEAHVGRKVQPTAERRETIVAHSQRSG